MIYLSRPLNKTHLTKGRRIVSLDSFNMLAIYSAGLATRMRRMISSSHLLQLI